MNTSKNNLAENLRSLRRLNRLTLEEVAERVGVTRQAVAKWEQGESAPDLANGTALADLFGVTLDDLVRFCGGDCGVQAPPPRGKHLFGTVTVGERGQIVIPKRARELFGIRTGDSLMVLGDEGPGSRGLALVDPGVFLAQMEQFTRGAQRKEETP